MKKSLLEILKFEIIFKLIILFAVAPLLNLAYRFYYAKVGVVFNTKIFTSLLSVNGILFLIILLSILFVSNYFEIAVILLTINKNIRGLDYSLTDVVDKAFLQTTRLFKRRNWKAAFYFILLIPFVHTGYLVSLSPRITIPPFILEYLRESLWGNGAILLLYGYLYYLALSMIFIPIAMVLGAHDYPKAAQLNTKWYRQLPAKELLQILGMFILWIMADTTILNKMGGSILSNSDITFSLFKYMIQSSSYLEDFGLWILYRLLQISVMTLFLYTLESKLWCDGRLPAPSYELAPYVTAIHSKSADNSTVEAFIVFKNKIGDALKHFWRSRRHRGFYWTLLVLFLLIAVALAFFEIPLVHKPFVIGHRGTSTEVENTVESITAGAAQGNDFGELDVQLTKDEVPVVFHDETLRRLTGRDAEVGDLTLAEIKELTLYENGKTAKIPTLQEIIEAAKATPTQTGLLIELKPFHGNDTLLAEKVQKVVEDEDFGDKAMFMSFSLSSMQTLQKAHPEWWIGYTAYGTAGQLDESIWDYDVDFLALEETDIRYSLLSLARQNTIPVYVWTVESESSALKYYEMGADGVITNEPWEAKAARDEYVSDHPQSYLYEGDGHPRGELFE